MPLITDGRNAMSDVCVERAGGGKGIDWLLTGFQSESV
jgi:hypothetical protein